MQKGSSEDNRILSWIFVNSGDAKRMIIPLAIVQMLLALGTVSIAWRIRGLVDHALQKDMQAFGKQAILLLITFAAMIALRAVYRFNAEKAKASVENSLKDRLFKQLMDSDFQHVRQIHSGEWMNRFTSDTVVIADTLSGTLPEAIGMVAKLIGAVTLLLMLLPKLLFVMIPGGIALLLFSYLFRKRLKEYHKEVQEADGRLRVFVTEHLSNLLVVHSFGIEKQSRSQALQKMEEHKEKRLKRISFSNLCNVGFGTLMNGTYALGAIFCGYGIIHELITYGTFVAVIQLISQIQSPLANVTGFLPKYYAMLASAERLMESEDEVSSEMATHTFVIKENKAVVELRNVAFAYEDDHEQVFDNVNLAVYPGDVIAMTGESGSGKSTLLHVLMGIYEPTEGERIVNSEGKLFAYVPQGNQLMSGTIREILTFGENNRSDEELWEALHIACLANVVRELDGGLNATLREKGQGISEGQTQRLAVARAIVSGNPVLVLDEATSSLDAATEEEMLNNIKQLKDRSVVIVTHRPKALEICNKRVELIQNQCI